MARSFKEAQRLAPVPRLRAYSGPALLSYGFRPFFLMGATYAGLAVLVWLGLFFDGMELPTAFVPRDWHIHEMLYGYLPAVATGFLLTAIPNWTGRMPLQGSPLLLLVGVWLMGRIAVSVSAIIGAPVAALIDLSFLCLVAAACAREILGGRNWRNLPVLGLLLLLLAGNAGFHWETIVRGTADFGTRIGIAGALLLLMLIGGRIVPSFTRNWLVRQNPGRLPRPFARFDLFALAVSAIALLCWTCIPGESVTGLALCIAAIVQTVRLARWAGDRTWRDPLVLILHAAYAFVPVGFFLLGAAAFGIVPETAGIHAWSAGAIGLMTLAVMTRATLGHTGRALVASPATQAIYVAGFVAALARIIAALYPTWSTALLIAAGAAWVAAFLGFSLVYGPMLLAPRRAAATASD
jgi:uncharacterized protein involved in response to NO